jgi:(p)ppGpp synthase/HD superfamily hydrolase
MLKTHTLEERLVAVLYDIIEDTTINIDYLSSRFGSIIAEAVWSLTRQENDDGN